MHEKAAEEFKKLGFTAITIKPHKRRKKTQKGEPGTAASVMIVGLDKFKKNTHFEMNADVIIEYVGLENE